MLYTVTIVMQDKEDGSYLEQVYLIDSEAQTEEEISQQARAHLDTARFALVLTDDVRPLLFGDFSDAVFSRHFEDRAAYDAVWAGEENHA